MAQYVIDMQQGVAKLVAGKVTPSTANPGMVLFVNEDGSTICVEPDGSHVRNIPAGDPNWDSPYCWAQQLGDKLVYRSGGGQAAGFLVIG